MICGDSGMQRGKRILRSANHSYARFGTSFRQATIELREAIHLPHRPQVDVHGGKKSFQLSRRASFSQHSVQPIRQATTDSQQVSIGESEAGLQQVVAGERLCLQHLGLAQLPLEVRCAVRRRSAVVGCGRSVGGEGFGGLS